MGLAGGMQDACGTRAGARQVGATEDGILTRTHLPQPLETVEGLDAHWKERQKQGSGE